MRYLVLALAILLTSSCASLWPFGDNEAAHCMDDNSCEAANPIDEALTTGAWYCYGVSRNEPWDCRKSADDSRITAISDETQEEPFETTPQPERAEMQIAGETISHNRDRQVTRQTSSETSSESIRAPRPPQVQEPVVTGSSANLNLFDHPDDFYAVQLIALQSVDEIIGYAADHNLDDPAWVRIESQGSEWYVLLLGVYANRAQADIAANSWSDTEQPDTRPWVRPLGPLKRAVLRAQSRSG